MVKEEILNIVKTNKVYSDSDINIKIIEIDGEDKNGDSVFFDVEFLIEDLDPQSEFTQIVKTDILEDVWKGAQMDLLDRFFKCGILNVNEYNSEVEKLSFN